MSGKIIVAIVVGLMAVIVVSSTGHGPYWSPTEMLIYGLLAGGAVALTIYGLLKLRTTRAD